MMHQHVKYQIKIQFSTLLRELDVAVRAAAAGRRRAEHRRLRGVQERVARALEIIDAMPIRG